MINRVTCPKKKLPAGTPGKVIHSHFKRRLYVLEASPLLARHPAFAGSNPRHVPGMECLYVGTTSQDVEERFLQHFNGHATASAVVGGAVIRIRYDLVSETRLLPRDEALKKERQLARALRKLGYAVWQA